MEVVLYPLNSLSGTYLSSLYKICAYLFPNFYEICVACKFLECGAVHEGVTHPSQRILPEHGGLTLKRVRSCSAGGREVNTQHFSCRLYSLSPLIRSCGDLLELLLQDLERSEERRVGKECSWQRGE